MDTVNQSADVRTYVRQHYGSLAAEPVDMASCCGSDCGCGTETLSLESSLYSPEELATLPAGAKDLSLGCGNPVAIASLQPGQVVADLGSGGGIDCFLAAQKVGPEGQVIGIDMTSNMIDAARCNQTALGLENVEFRLGEIEHLPLADASVDVLISNCVINLSPDKPQVFREAFRVLRPGGRIAVSDVVAAVPLSDAVRSDLNSWAGCLGGALETSEYQRLLDEAGFVEVEIREVDDLGDKSPTPASAAPVYQAYIAADKPVE